MFQDNNALVDIENLTPSEKRRRKFLANTAILENHKALSEKKYLSRKSEGQRFELEQILIGEETFANDSEVQLALRDLFAFRSLVPNHRDLIQSLVSLDPSEKDLYKNDPIANMRSQFSWSSLQGTYASNVYKYYCMGSVYVSEQQTDDFLREVYAYPPMPVQTAGFGVMKLSKPARKRKVLASPVEQESATVAPKKRRTYNRKNPLNGMVQSNRILNNSALKANANVAQQAPIALPQLINPLDLPLDIPNQQHYNAAQNVFTNGYNSPSLTPASFVTASFPAAFSYNPSITYLQSPHTNFNGTQLQNVNLNTYPPNSGNIQVGGYDASGMTPIANFPQTIFQSQFQVASPLLIPTEAFGSIEVRPLPSRV